MKRKYQVLALIVTFLFSGVLYFGVFQNPNFDFNDFCMGLATELIGAVVAVILLEPYISLKSKLSKKDTR